MISKTMIIMISKTMIITINGITEITTRIVGRTHTIASMKSERLNITNVMSVKNLETAVN